MADWLIGPIFDKPIIESAISDNKLPMFQINPLNKLSLTASFLNFTFITCEISNPVINIPKQTGKKKSWVLTLPTFIGTSWLPNIKPAKIAANNPFLVFLLLVLLVELTVITPNIIKAIPIKPVIIPDVSSRKTNAPHKKEDSITRDDITGTALESPRLAIATRDIAFALPHKTPPNNPYGLKLTG